jgi:hypothetical protein
MDSNDSGDDDDDNDEDEVDDDYIHFVKELFEFYDVAEDERVDNLQVDFSTGQTLNYASNSNNEWKISSDKDDVDVEVSEQFDSSGKKRIRSKVARGGKKKKNMDPTTSFKYKRF